MVNIWHGWPVISLVLTVSGQTVRNRSRTGEVSRNYINNLREYLGRLMTGDKEEFCARLVPDIQELSVGNKSRIMAQCKEEFEIPLGMLNHYYFIDESDLTRIYHTNCSTPGTSRVQTAICKHYLRLYKFRVKLHEFLEPNPSRLKIKEWIKRNTPKIHSNVFGEFFCEQNAQSELRREICAQFDGQMSSTDK